MDKPTSYLFLPYLRQGMSPYLQKEDDHNVTSVQERAKIDLSMNNYEVMEQNNLVRTNNGHKVVSLYGPGDILDIDHALIKSHDPESNVIDFEPNCFPSIEFMDADFPWRYTPIPPDKNNNLNPWLVLIVLVAEDTHITTKEFDKRPESECVIYNVSVHHLPNLNESWRYAHVQVACDVDSTAVSIKHETFSELLKTNPERVTSRLVSDRRLRPCTLYNAFLVPVFKLGSLAAGLEESDDNIAIDTLSWERDSDTTVNIPYYYSFEFRTGEL